MNPLIKVILYDEKDNQNKLYLSSDENEKDIGTCDLDKMKDGWTLRGFYYGSGTCIRSDGLGWIGGIRYPTCFEELREMKDFPKVTNKKRIKIIVSVENEHEEFTFEYPKDFYNPYIPLDGFKFVKGIFFRELSRFRYPELDGTLLTPVEISGVKVSLPL